MASKASETVFIFVVYFQGHIFIPSLLILKGLIPGKNYSYRVQSGNNVSEGFEFTARRDDEVSYFKELLII